MTDNTMQFDGVMWIRQDVADAVTESLHADVSFWHGKYTDTNTILQTAKAVIAAHENLDALALEARDAEREMDAAAGTLESAYDDFINATMKRS